MDIRLSDLIRIASDFYSENCCKYILKQVLTTLDQLHSRNVIHGNVNTDRVYTGEDGVVKFNYCGYVARLIKEKTDREAKYGSFTSIAPELI